MLAAIFAIQLTSIFSVEKVASELSAKERLNIANEFFNNELYARAIEEYEYVVDDDSFDKNKRANILFTIAETYKDKLGDYRNALASYLLIKHLFPQSELKNDVERGIVECLDRMGKTSVAQNRLEKTVELGSDTKDVPEDQIIAKINNRVISLTDLNRWISMLPPSERKQYATPEMRLEFLKERIADQQLYDAALRAGYDKKEEIKYALEQAERQILAGAYYKDRITGGFSASELELREFYDQNMETMFGGKPFSEVQDSVMSKYQEMKLRDAQMSLSQSITDAENVQIFPKNLGLIDE
jgi:tetratricopeptide (TPR) repeat protein